MDSLIRWVGVISKITIRPQTTKTQVFFPGKVTYSNVYCISNSLDVISQINFIQI